MLLRYFAGINETQAMRSAAGCGTGINANTSLNRLIENLGRKKNFGQVRIEKNGEVIQFGRMATTF